jgi:hypothetical protein
MFLKACSNMAYREILYAMPSPLARVYFLTVERLLITFPPDWSGLGLNGTPAVYSKAMATKTPAPTPWPPTRITRVIRGLGTSTGPLYVMTDVGRAYVKTLGNPEGPDALVSEWIGTRLARWLGLRTFDVAVVDYPAELEVALPQGCRTQAGPAFIAREAHGRPWSGEENDLALLENADDIGGLVVFDTWTRNYDRYAGGDGVPRRNFRNVFFSEEGARKGHYQLLAMDHTECFRTGRQLTSRGLLDLDAIRDERLFGLFPEFRSRVTREDVQRFVSKLATFQDVDFESCAGGLPSAWGLRADTRNRLKTLCVDRAKFLASNVEKILEDGCRWQPALPGTNLR